MAASVRFAPTSLAPPTHTVGWWGMVCLVATEAAFFACLLFSYGYLASNSMGPWPPHGAPELRVALANTALLAASSLVFWWGQRRMDRGDRGSCLGATLITIALGSAFVALQFGKEWPGLPFRPRDDAYASLFYTITGAHGVHVVAGLFMLLWLFLRVRGNATLARDRLLVSVIGLYWHFVGVVWLAVLTTLYLSPRFL